MKQSSKIITESNQSEIQFQHLKKCVHQLLEASVEQERLMCALNESLEASIKENGNYKLFFERISSAMQKFTNNNNLSEPIEFKIQDIEYVHIRFYEFLKTLEEKDYSQNMEIRRLKTTINVIQSQHAAEIFRIEEKHQSSVQKQCEQLQNQLSDAVVRAERAMLQAKSLDAEVAVAKSKYEKEIAEKSERIQELEKELSDFISKQNNSNINSKNALESVLNTTRKELIKMKCERDSANSELLTLSAKLEATETYIAELDNLLNKQLTMDRSTRKQLNETNKVNKQLQGFIKSIELSMRRLYNMIDSEFNFIRNWNWGQIFEEHNIEEFFENVMKIISELKRKSMMNRDNRSQTKRLKYQIEELNYELNKFKSTFKNNHCSISKYEKILAVKVNELEATISERDYYLQIINEQTEELSTVKADFELQKRELKEQIDLLKGRHFCSGKCLKSQPTRTGINESCTIRFRAYRKPMSTNNTNISQTNKPNSVNQSNIISELQQRLESLEKNMYKVSEEKESLRTQNQQLTDLLRRLTDQNHRLSKELDNCIVESMQVIKLPSYSSGKTVDNATRIQHDNHKNNQYHDHYPNEQVEMRDGNGDHNVCNEEKLLGDNHDINNLNNETINERLFNCNNNVTPPNRTLENTSPVQSNTNNKLDCTQEQTDTTPTQQSVSDDAVLSDGQSHDSDDLVSKETEIDKNENNTEVNDFENQQSIAFDTKIPNQSNSSTPNIDVHITADNYETFLNFSYQNAKDDDTPKHETQHEKHINIENADLKNTAAEVTGHNAN
ncbi:unnamed protein product [Schistosoma turkestanicum]|nr:unnamed protein product [Schistosoma turkestanicum]